MKKLVPLHLLLIALIACNRPATPKPDTDRVIKDTVAQIINVPFDQAPQTHKILVNVEAKEEQYAIARSAEITDLLAGIKNPPEHFSIDPTKNSEIKSAHGTKISFAPHCFTNNKGQEITGTVDVELKESFSLGDMLRNGLSGSQHSSLYDTHNTFYINAVANGQPLILKKTGEIDVQFANNQQPPNGYNLYNSATTFDQPVLWNPVKGNWQQKRLNASQAQFSYPMFNYAGLNIERYLHETLRYPDEAKRNELSAEMDVSFTITEKGKVADIKTSESYKVFRQEINRVIGNMPDWKPAVSNGKKIATAVALKIDFNIRRHDQIMVEYQETDVRALNDGTDIGNNNKATAAHNDLFIDQLGWYTFAKEIKTPTPKADLIVKNDAQGDVKMILKHSNCITAAENYVGYSRFRTLPVGADVCLVAVRVEKGQAYYAIQSLRLEKQNIVSLNWKAASKREIEQAIDRIKV